MSVPPGFSTRRDFSSAAAQRFRRPPPQITRAINTRLFEHPWPGNVRELRNFADRVVLKMSDAGDEEINPMESLAQKVERYEASLIRDVLRSTERRRTSDHRQAGRTAQDVLRQSHSARDRSGFIPQMTGRCI